MKSVQENPSSMIFDHKYQELPPPFSAERSILASNSRAADSGYISPLPGVLPNDIVPFLKQELGVPRLNRIHGYLWLVGRAGNIRPLHRQKVLGREIVITEEADLHLVWRGSQIFIKPLPKFLLDHEFVRTYITAGELPLYKDACGFLASYTRLIRHESDFLIAKELNLISPSLNITWEQWSIFSAEIRKNAKCVNRRYIYGELRMTRLNFIYRILLLDSRGLYYGYTQYVSFFQSNFGWLLLAFAYVSVLLAAMQTVLSSKFGLENVEMRRSFGLFSFAVIMAITGILILVVLLFMGAFLGNLIATLRHKREEEKRRAELIV